MMDQQEPQFLEFGQGPKRRRLAYRFDRGRGETAPVVVWLSGFLSDMASTKVAALSDWSREHGYAMLRFDYSGHGISEGSLLEASIGDWLAEAAAMLALTGKRRLIFVGSWADGLRSCWRVPSPNRAIRGSPVSCLSRQPGT